MKRTGHRRSVVTVVSPVMQSKVVPQDSLVISRQHHETTTSNPSCDPKDNAVRGSSTRQSSDAVRDSSTSSVRKKQ